MAKILDDAKVAGMLGDVNGGLSQVKPAVNQIEQWNSLASNIKEIMQMVMNRQQNAQPQQQQFAQANPVAMQNTAPVVTVVPQAPAPNLVVDIPLLKQKILQFKEQIKLFPDGVKQMTLQQVAETSPDAINNFIDMYTNQITQEIKGCVRLQ